MEISRVHSDGVQPGLISRLQRLPMRHRWLRWAVLAMALGFSAAITYYFSVEVRREAQSRFDAEALAMSDALESRLRAYGDVLFAALYQAKQAGRNRVVSSAAGA